MPESDLPQGDVPRPSMPVPGYRLTACMGKGASGEIWRAESSDGEVAVKFVDLPPGYTWREFEGLHRLKSIRSPYLVPIFGIWIVDKKGDVFEDSTASPPDLPEDRIVDWDTIAVPVEGARAVPTKLIIATGLGESNLEERLQESRNEHAAASGSDACGIPPDELLEYMRDAARGIDFLREEGIDRCDIKPENLLLIAGSVQVQDYGVTRYVDGEARRQLRNALYAAPELFDGKPHARSDQYCLAVSYAYMRTGRLPFSEDIDLESPAAQSAVERTHREGRLDFSALPATERDVMVRATRRDPETRWPSCVDMVAALEKVIDPPDMSIDGYRLIERLGKGAFGEVWRAEGPGGLEVAVKFVDLSKRGRWREFEGLDRVKNIRSPYLVPISGIWIVDRKGDVIQGFTDPPDDLPDEGTLDGETFVVAPESPNAPPAELIIAMGLGDRNLLERLQELREESPDAEDGGACGIPPGELLEYMRDAAKGIDFLHAEGISHCDIKPQNLLIIAGSVQVCDYGVARYVDSGPREQVGSPPYAAPEMWDGNPHRLSDEYCLAVSYAHMRMGRLPFPEGMSLTRLSVEQAHREGALDFSSLPENERAVIARATQIDPEARWPSCVEMVDALDEAIHPRETRRSRWSFVTAGLLALLIVAVAFLGGRECVLERLETDIREKVKQDAYLEAGGQIDSLPAVVTLFLGDKRIDELNDIVVREWRAEFEECLRKDEFEPAERWIKEAPNVFKKSGSEDPLEKILPGIVGELALRWGNDIASRTGPELEKEFEEKFKERNNHLHGLIERYPVSESLKKYCTSLLKSRYNDAIQHLREWKPKQEEHGDELKCIETAWGLRIVSLWKEGRHDDVLKEGESFREEFGAVDYPGRVKVAWCVSYSESLRHGRWEEAIRLLDTDAPLTDDECRNRKAEWQKTLDKEFANWKSKFDPSNRSEETLRVGKELLKKYEALRKVFPSEKVRERCNNLAKWTGEPSEIQKQILVLQKPNPGVDELKSALDAIKNGDLILSPDLFDVPELQKRLAEGLGRIADRVADNEDAKAVNPDRSVDIVDRAIDIVDSACDEFSLSGSYPVFVAQYGKLWGCRIRLRLTIEEPPFEDLLEKADPNRMRSKENLDPVVELWLIENAQKGMMPTRGDLVEEDERFAPYLHYIRAKHSSNAEERLSELLACFDAKPAESDVMNKEGRLAKVAETAVAAAWEAKKQEGPAKALEGRPFGSEKTAKKVCEVLRAVQALQCVPGNLDVRLKTCLILAADQMQPRDTDTLVNLGPVLIKRLGRNDPTEVSVCCAYLRGLVEAAGAGKLGTLQNGDEDAVKTCERVMVILRDDAGGWENLDLKTARLLYQEFLVPTKNIADRLGGKGNTFGFCEAAGDLVVSLVERDKANGAISNGKEAAPEIAAEFLQDAIKAAPIAGIERQRVAKLHVRRARMLFKEEEPDLETIKNHVKRALSLDRALAESHALLAHVDLLEAHAATDMEKYLHFLDASIEHGRKAVELVEAQGRAAMPKECGKWYLHLSEALLERGNYAFHPLCVPAKVKQKPKTSKEYFDEAKKYAEEIMGPPKLEVENDDYPSLAAGNAYEDLACIAMEDPELNYREAFRKFEDATKQVSRLVRERGYLGWGRALYKSAVLGKPDITIDGKNKEQRLDEAIVKLKLAQGSATGSVKAEVLSFMGQAYCAKGEYTTGLDLLKEAVDVAENAKTSDRLTYATTRVRYLARLRSEDQSASLTGLPRTRLQTPEKVKAWVQAEIAGKNGRRDEAKKICSGKLPNNLNRIDFSDIGLLLLRCRLREKEVQAGADPAGLIADAEAALRMPLSGESLNDAARYAWSGRLKRYLRDFEPVDLVAADGWGRLLKELGQSKKLHGAVYGIMLDRYQAYRESVNPGGMGVAIVPDPIPGFKRMAALQQELKEKGKGNLADLIAPLETRLNAMLLLKQMEKWMEDATKRERENVAAFLPKEISEIPASDEERNKMKEALDKVFRDQLFTPSE